MYFPILFVVVVAQIYSSYFMFVSHIPFWNCVESFFFKGIGINQINLPQHGLIELLEIGKMKTF